jgi:sugar phosphate isomerase/epimerase
MRFLFSTGSLYTYGLDRCFALAAAAGFDGIELMVDGRWDTRQPAYLLGLLGRHGLPIVVVHAPLEGAPIAGWPADRAGQVGATVKLAEALAAQTVVHHLPLRVRVGWLRVGPLALPLVLPGRDPYGEWITGEYAAFQRTTQVALCIENLPAVRLGGRRINPGRWNTPGEIVRFSHLTLDTTHLGTWGLEPTAVYEQIRPRVRHVHLSNFDGKEHRRPEAGQLRLDHFLARLAADGFEGTITLELSPGALGAGDADEALLERLAASLRFCREACANAPTAHAASQESSS